MSTELMTLLFLEIAMGAELYPNLELSKSAFNLAYTNSNQVYIEINNPPISILLRTY